MNPNSIPSSTDNSLKLNNASLFKDILKNIEKEYLHVDTTKDLISNTENHILSPTNSESSDDSGNLSEQKVIQEQETSNENNGNLLCGENEVFVGGISPLATESDLISLFNMGTEDRVQNVRLIKDKASNQNRGFAFILYKDKSDCQLAVSNLDNTELKGKLLRVKLSENKRKLFMGGLPKDLSRAKLLDILNQSTPGISNIDFLQDPDNSSRNRGFVFIEYKDHYLAESALKVFSSPGFKVVGTSITINWSDPIQEPNEEIMKQVKSVYVKNLPEYKNEKDLKVIFEEYGEIEKIVIPMDNHNQTSRRDFAFVHYIDRSSVEKLLEHNKSNPICYDKRKLFITLAKPIDKKHRDELKNRKLKRSISKQQQLHQQNNNISMLHNGVSQVYPSSAYNNHHMINNNFSIPFIYTAPQQFPTQPTFINPNLFNHAGMNVQYKQNYLPSTSALPMKTINNTFRYQPY
ncbi:RNA-binding region RNP-1 domain-containing protein [Tieghemostelium lacteum]|uniref:RNA-binding region RNP-1 domain-containing protein n=1 Tax=Tieghemostelium lacteum TaxID=361077 RepID=A0A151Z5R4_TIELA|nr:RNA-binding region RNP-1 domain-containing protein [Tieghemostelium lacteum]|eukprot:KYQ89277.1 RNA-binding region RNP-1 domain-containing protein [Tieghemostelium lacteum]